jgi:hypothetical protein
MEIFRGKNFEKSFSKEIPRKIPRNLIITKNRPLASQPHNIIKCCKNIGIYLHRSLLPIINIKIFSVSVKQKKLETFLVPRKFVCLLSYI